MTEIKEINKLQPPFHAILLKVLLATYNLLQTTIQPTIKLWIIQMWLLHIRFRLKLLSLSISSHLFNCVKSPSLVLESCVILETIE